MRILRRCLPALCLALLGFAPPVPGADQWNIAELMQTLASVERSHARFVERKYLKVLESPLELSGTLTYSRPGHLEKRTLAPKAEILELKGDRITLTSPARNERRELKLQDYPVLWGFIESIRATLGGDIKALERFYRVELDGARAKWRLFLVPRDRRMTRVITLIRIDGNQGRVERIEVQEARGDRSVMQIYEEVP